jgi:hypothetical protein
MNGVTKNEITPHHPQSRVPVVNTQKWRKTHALHIRPSTDVRSRKMITPTFMWNSTCRNSASTPHDRHRAAPSVRWSAAKSYPQSHRTAVGGFSSPHVGQSFGAAMGRASV